jgi:Raf kinase inhibitor-like YbhB/YbcL family protein
MQSSRVLPVAILLSALSPTAFADGFVLDSQSFGSGTTLSNSQVYNQRECHGGNLSPQLSWSGAPEGTQSYAVTMFDTDARDGRGLWHWVLFDIDAKTMSLPVGAGDANKAPLGSSSARNGMGDLGYSGPCPPQDEKQHHYVVTVYALRAEHIGLRQGADAETAKQAIESNAIASATAQAVYGR